MFTDFWRLKNSKKPSIFARVKQFLYRNFYFSIFLNSRNLNSYDNWKISRTYDSLVRRKYTTLCLFSFLGIILMVITNVMDWSDEYMSLIYLLPTTWKQSPWRFFQEKMLHVVKFTNVLNTIVCIFLLIDYYITSSDKKWDQWYQEPKQNEAKKRKARRIWKRIVAMQAKEGNANPKFQQELMQKLIDEDLGSEMSLTSQSISNTHSYRQSLSLNGGINPPSRTEEDDHYSKFFFIRTFQIWGQRAYALWDSSIKYKFLLELAIITITPIPFLEKIPSMVHYSDSIGLLMFLRLYQAFNLLLIHSPMYKRRALMAKASSKAVRSSTTFSWRMALKIFLYSNAAATVTIFVVLLATCLAFCVYVVERETTCTSCINHYFDAVYYTLISMTSMGYGDFVPASKLGKVLAALSGICGIAFIGLINYVFIQKLTPTTTQKAVLDWLKYQHYTESWLEHGIRIIQIRFLYKHKKCTEAYKTKMEKALLKKMRKTRKKVINFQVESGQDPDDNGPSEVEQLKKEVGNMKKLLEKQNRLLEMVLKNNIQTSPTSPSNNFDEKIEKKNSRAAGELKIPKTNGNNKNMSPISDNTSADENSNSVTPKSPRIEDFENSKQEKEEEN